MAEKLTTLAKRLRPFINGQIGAIAATGAYMQEGPGIDLVGNRIGLGGDSILLYNSDGTPVEEFAITQAGMIAALAASTSGNTVLSQKEIVIALTTGITVPAGVILRRANLSFTGFSGTAVTLSANAELDDSIITYVGTGASALGLLATGSPVAIRNVNCYVSGSTSCTGISLSGSSIDDTCITLEVYGSGTGPGSNVGILLGDYVQGKEIYGFASGGATKNVGIKFNGTTDSWINSSWGIAEDTDSYGVEVAANKIGDVRSGVFARGETKDLLINTGATLNSYGFNYRTVTNTGTFTHTHGSEGAPNLFDVRDYGAIGDGLTDATAAIQAAIDAAETNGGGTVYFPAGVYIIGGALKDVSGANSQIVLPSIDAAVSQQIGITLLGEVAPYTVPSVIRTVNLPISGAVLKSTLNSGAGGAMIGVYGPTVDNEYFSNIVAGIENLTFRMPVNPVLSAVNLRKAAGTYINNVAIDTANYTVQTATQPTTATSHGIILPMMNNGAWTFVDNLLVINFYTGVEIGEHATLNNITIMGCLYAVEIPEGWHSIYAGRICCQWCTNNLNFTGGASYIVIEELNIEHYNPAYLGAKWYDHANDIVDASNYGDGIIYYHVIDTVTGVDNASWTVSGGADLVMIPITDPLSGFTLVKVSANDTTGGYLNGKLVEGTYITLTENNDGGNETLTIDVDMPLNGLNDVNTSGVGTGDIIYKTAGDWEDYPLGIGSDITNDGSSIKIGDIAGGNYFSVDLSSGEIGLNGNATVFEDIRVEPAVRQAAGAGVPSFEKYFDDAPGTSKGVYLLSFTDEAVAGNEKEVFFNMQMPHSWKIGSDIHIHVHFVPAATVNSSDIIWGLEYCWKSIGEVFGDTVIIQSSTTLLPDDANITAGKHYLAEFTDISPGVSASSLSSILIGRLFRNSSAAGDTYTNKVGLLYIDAHYEVDSLGSTEEYEKTVLLADSDGETLLDSDGVELTE